jgi:nitrogen regulatory protein PII
MLRVCVKDADMDRAINAIAETARSGDVGDGKIFAYPVSSVVRIRTGEEDEAAL